jgi:hypothetical protein
VVLRARVCEWRDSRLPEEGSRLKYPSLAIQLVLLGAAVSCKDSSSRLAKTELPAISPADSIVGWARSVDSLADSLQVRAFKFPPRSTEGGAGRFYQLADSSVRIDIDDLGEMGRHLNKFFSRGRALRLAVMTDERYDQPLSGNVVKTTVDSTWFAADSAIRWRDSLGVVRVQRDSVFRAHGRDVFAEYQWAMRMAGAASQQRSKP